MSDEYSKAEQECKGCFGPCGQCKEKLSAEEIRLELQRAYRWGVANGENRSEKNFNDYLQTSHAKDFLAATEQLQKEKEELLQEIEGHKEKYLRLAKRHKRSLPPKP